ncbi:MAG: gamma carbonic anhydrase family protein [bacterium]
MIAPSAVIAGDVTLAAGVNVWHHVTIRGDMAPVIVGRDTNVQDNAVIHTNIDLPTRIGVGVTIGHSAIIHAATIHDHALIGMGSIILDGAVIGEGAMVGAGTLVPPRKTVPPYTLVVGNPMQVIRELTVTERQNNRDNVERYLALAQESKLLQEISAGSAIDET